MKTNFLEKWFQKHISPIYELNYGRHIIKEEVGNYLKEDLIENNSIRILDLGGGQGKDLCNARDTIELHNKNINVEMFSIESYGPNCKVMSEKGIQVFQLDIEKDVLPFETNSFDIIICNQIIEHTKEIFFIFSEISRILKKNALCIVGVPNLAALHNRIFLLFGEQPPTINLFGAHVRAFTKRDFIDFIQKKEFFEVTTFRGSGFYPFPWISVAKVFAKWFPSFSVFIFFSIRRTRKNGNFISVLDGTEFETPWYRGEKETDFRR